MNHVCDAECGINGVIHTGAAHHGSGLQPGFLGLCVISERGITTLYRTPSLPKPKSSILFTWNHQNEAVIIQNPEIERDLGVGYVFVTNNVSDGKTSLQRCERLIECVQDTDRHRSKARDSSFELFTPHVVMSYGACLWKAAKSRHDGAITRFPHRCMRYHYPP